MPRPKLPKGKKLTEVTFLKMRPAERRRLNQMSREGKRSRSAILREAFLLYEKMFQK